MNPPSDPKLVDLKFEADDYETRTHYTIRIIST